MKDEDDFSKAKRSPYAERVKPGVKAQADEIARLPAAVQWYREGRISGSQAAQIAGMTRLEFLDELARRKLDVIKVDLDQLREEIEPFAS